MTFVVSSKVIAVISWKPLIYPTSDIAPSFRLIVTNKLPSGKMSAG
jgi:hypothetical protein